MTIINTSPDRIIQLGYEGEDRVTVLRFRYGEDWLENGEGIFRIRVRRHGELTAYNAQLVADDAKNNCLLMTVTNTELSVKGSGEMQVVYSGADFVKKSPIYSYNVSRAVDEAVDPPAQDVYTQIIESLSDLQTDVRQISSDVADLSELTAEKIGDMTALTTEAKSSLVSAINEVNSKSVDITVDSALSDTSENPVQNKTITGAIREVSSYARDLSGVIDGLGEDVEGLETALRTKADTQTVSALADAVNGLDSDVQGLQTTVQSKADASTVTALSGTVSSLQTAVQGKANTTTVTALTNRVTAVETDKASHDEVDTVRDDLNLFGQVAQQYMEQTNTALLDLQRSKTDKSYVDTQLATKASTQTVSDLSDDVSDLQTGLTGKVGDVQINGNSVVTDGVANVPLGYGLRMVSNQLTTSLASFPMIKGGGNDYNPIVPSNQHTSVFYGLAKIAGRDELNSTLPVGTYTDEAKVAIQKMLGIYEAPWELIRGETFTNSTEAPITIDVDDDGNSFELTDIRMVVETPVQDTASGIGSYGGIYAYFNAPNGVAFDSVYTGAWTQAANSQLHSSYIMIEQKDGMIVKSQVRQSTSGNPSAITYIITDIGGQSHPFILSPQKRIYNKIQILSATGKVRIALYGKRKWT